MGKNQSLIIPFVGLKEGLHHYNFELDASFFSQFEYSIIKDGLFKVELDFNKKSNLFELKFAIKGEIFTSCDRCLLPLTLAVKSKEELIVKFGETQFQETDEILIIAHGEYELDLNEILYEYINLLMPIKVKHSKIENCDQEVIKKLKKLSQKEESQEIDPRWSALSKFKDK